MKINRETDALVVIDMQYDFTLPSGSLYVGGGEFVVSGIRELAPLFDNIYFTQDSHPHGHKSFASSHPGKKPFDVIEMYGHPQVLWPDHCVTTTKGAEIVSGLVEAQLWATAIIRKGTNPLVDSYSAFRENFGPDGNRATTGFGALLKARGIKRVFLVGLARDYCVRFSAEDSVDEGFETYVVDDLTKSVMKTTEDYTNTTNALTTKGVKLIKLADVEGA